MTAGRRFTHQLVDLGEGRVLDVQPVSGDAIQSCVVQHHLTMQKKKTHVDGQRTIIVEKKEEEFPSSGTRRVKSINGTSVFGYQGSDAVKEPLLERHSALLSGHKTANVKDTLYGCNGAAGSWGRFY